MRLAALRPDIAVRQDGEAEFGVLIQQMPFRRARRDVGRDEIRVRQRLLHQLAHLLPPGVPGCDFSAA